MKTFFATVVYGESFEETFGTLLYSIKKHNPTFGFPFFIFHTVLSEGYKNKLKKIYNNLYFQQVNREHYREYEKNSPKYWTLEAFRLCDADKVIFLDADLLCVSKIDSLLEINVPISMHRETYRPCFNSGLIIIGKENINSTIFHDLIQMKRNPKIFGHDQQLINRYFDGKIITLNPKFNVFVTEAFGERLKKAVFLHYIHKPNSPSRLNENLKQLWEEYHNGYDRITNSIG